MDSPDKFVVDGNALFLTLAAASHTRRFVNRNPVNQFVKHEAVEFFKAGVFSDKVSEAVNIGLGSLHSQAESDEIIVPFKNLINEAYCRDTSIKIRSQLEIKRQRGDFIGSFAVFGYPKDPSDRHKLVPDEYAADVVRDIFNWKLDGISALDIAARLAASGISTPSYKVKRLVQKPREEWAVIKNNHEPIIDKFDFDTAQRVLAMDTRTSQAGQPVELFSGLIYCGECGGAMVRKTVLYGKKKYVYYVCANHKEHTACYPTACGRTSWKAWFWRLSRHTSERLSTLIIYQS